MDVKGKETEKAMGNIEDLLPPLKPESLQCIRRFMAYIPPKKDGKERRYPRRRSAAVALILFVGRLGDLYVLLSTRAGDMRTYAQDTALPGGKYDQGDIDAEGTARREAYEEIGLPIDRDKVRKLCVLEPFLTGNSLIVTPVVLIITDHTLTPLLNPSEVSSLFSMPLSAFLHSRPSLIPSFYYSIQPRLSSLPLTFSENANVLLAPPPVRYAEDQGEVGGKDGRFYGWRDVRWGQGKVRMHRFLTGREGDGVKPVYGLTAAILIEAASIGYSTNPSFTVHAPGQRTMHERIKYEIIREESILRRAVENEGLWDDWKDLASALTSVQEGTKAKL